jgi:putative ABC transport system permease protein
MRRFALRLLSFFRSGRADAELARELAAHLQLLEDRFVAEGMSADEARLAARRAFGGQVEQTRLRHRDARSFRWMDDWWVDIKLGTRMLVKYPGLTLVGGLGMAVAIAISTASFAFFYAYLAAELPLVEGDRIVALENWNIEVNNEERQALHDYLLWRDELTSFEDVAAFRVVNRNLIVPGGASEPVRLAEMTASGFRIARVPPLLGRPLLPEDEQPGAQPVIVIGYDVWLSRFAGDRSIVGREVRLGNTSHIVVGVMPEGFLFPVNDRYWVPLRTDASRDRRGEGPEIFIFGRLARGVSIDDANAELAILGNRSAVAFPDTHAQLRPRVLPYASPILDIQDATMWQVAVMQLTMSILLIVVAVNVAILVYARTATRQGEIAVRTALGASRPRIIGQLFIEALVLAAGSAAVGLGIATFGLDQAHLIMSMEGSQGPYWIDYGVPWEAMVYVVGLTIVAAVIAGVLPAVQATSRRVQTTLRELSGATGMRLGRTWTLLIVSQVAFAVAALPTAVAMGWNEVRDTATQPLFAAERYLAARIAMDPDPPPGMDAATYRRTLTSTSGAVRSELVTRLEAESWVSDVTVATSPPGQEASSRIEVEGTPATSAAGHAAAMNRVDVDFFDAFDASTATGRRFTAADRTADAAADDASANRAVIVNRAFVRQILGDADALGRRVRYAARYDDDDGQVEASPWYEIVGVVSDLQANAVNPELVRPTMYHPLGSDERRGVAVVIRVSGGTPSAFVGRLREITAAIDPAVRLTAYPLVEIYRQEKIAARLVAVALALIMVSVLLLSAAGIYALMSFTVAQRRKEIGIRAALGADGRHLLQSVFARSARQLATGIVVGGAMATLADRMSGSDLLRAEGVVLLPAMSGLMLLVGLLAAFGPARRGLRIQPTQALRDQ